MRGKAIDDILRSGLEHFPVLRFLPVCLIFLVCSCSAGTASEVMQEPPRLIPFKDQIELDGLAGDWQGIHEYRVFSDIEGNVPDTADFQSRFRMAWDSAGLLFIFEVLDDVIYEDTVKFWNGDGVELFLSPSKGSGDIIQFSLRPALERSDTCPAIQYFDHRITDSLSSKKPFSEFRRKPLPGGYAIEGRISFEPLGIDPLAESCSPAIQVYFNDSDLEEDSNNFSLPWYPVRESYMNPYAFFTTLLMTGSGRVSREDNLAIPPEVRAYIVNNNKLYIKLLSDYNYQDHKILARVKGKNRRLRLDPSFYGLYQTTVQQELHPSPESDPDLRFYLDDSLFFSVNQLLLHRVYNETDEPNRFEKEIRIFEIRDHFNPPPSGAVLFAGSSTFRKWDDIEECLPGRPIINRGFGGSKMEDLNYYFDRIVVPYAPSRIFVYEGDNDIAAGYSSGKFLEDCAWFIRSCRERLPGTEIFFLSIKPSPARFRHWEEMKKANIMLSELCSQYSEVHYIDISEAILDKQGLPDPDLFVSDRLHFNEKGYAVLSEILNPVLNQ